MDACKIMVKKPFIFIIGLSESLNLCILHTFIFTWSPTLKEIDSNADVSYVFTLLMMSLMTGGAAFRTIYNFYNNNAYSVAKVMSLLSFVGLLLIYISKDFNTLLIGFIIYEVGVGLFYPTYSKIKADNLPKNNKGTLSNLFRIPFNIVVILLLVTTNKLLSIKGYLLLNVIISFILFLIYLIFLNKSSENKEKDE
jgi:hypothetical protein